MGRNAHNKFVEGYKVEPVTSIVPNTEPTTSIVTRIPKVPSKQVNDIRQNKKLKRKIIKRFQKEPITAVALAMVFTLGAGQTALSAIADYRLTNEYNNAKAVVEEYANKYPGVTPAEDLIKLGHGINVLVSYPDKDLEEALNELKDGKAEGDIAKQLETAMGEMKACEGEIIKSEIQQAAMEKEYVEDYGIVEDVRLTDEDGINGIEIISHDNGEEKTKTFTRDEILGENGLQIPKERGLNPALADKLKEHYRSVKDELEEIRNPDRYLKKEFIAIVKEFLGVTKYIPNDRRGEEGMFSSEPAQKLPKIQRDDDGSR